MRVLWSLAVLVLASGLVWANGDPVIYDRHTGAILPAKPTVARVERERLQIAFERPHASGPRMDSYDAVYMVRVQAEYWIVNPTDQPLTLQIGFPIPEGSLLLREPPVRVDEKPVDWQVHDYYDLLAPLRSTLLQAMRTWAARHPRAVEKARAAYRARPRGTPQERTAYEKALREFRAEMAKAGVTQLTPEADYALRAGPEAGETYRDPYLLREAILATGQRQLLPEGRWQIDTTVLEPVTGREVSPLPESEYGERQPLSLLTFPLRLEARGRQHLTVVYRQRPSQNPYEGGPLYNFSYVLRTIRGWASFGPIDVTITAPPGLLLTSRPKLKSTGLAKGDRVYHAVLTNPRENLQVVLAGADAQLPKLKANGQQLGRQALLTGRTPLVPTNAVHLTPRPRGMAMGENDGRGRRVAAQKGAVRPGQRGETPPSIKPQSTTMFQFRREDVLVRIRPGSRKMTVNDQSRSVSAPVRTRKGITYVPVEVLRALYPEVRIPLRYHAPTHTVLLDYRPVQATGRPSAPTLRSDSRPGRAGRAGAR